MASFPPPNSTLREIAKALGLSHSTVSRALHDNPRISIAVRQKVKDTAQAMGYRPNPIATALGEMRAGYAKPTVSGEIAWINHWEQPEQLRTFKEFDCYWKGASETAEHSGYRLEEFICGTHLSTSRFVKILQARNIRGILIPPHTRSKLPTSWNNLPWSNFCTIRFGYSTPLPACNLVSSDHLANALIAFNAMSEHGYQRIGFVSEESVTVRFSAGFLMAQLKIPEGKRIAPLLLPSPKIDGGGKEIFFQWLRKERPDAILTDNADLPIFLAEAGVRVPQDIGLAALSVLDGNITAGIDQNSEEIGRASVEMLVSQINHNQFGLPKVIRETLIVGKWIDGDSLPCKL